MSEGKAETGALVTGGLAGVLATDQQRKNAMFIDQERSKFEGVVKAYSTELFRYAYWLCRDRFTAEDLVHETYTRAWQGWGGLRDDRAAKGWLYTILRRLIDRLPVASARWCW